MGRLHILAAALLALLALSSGCRETLNVGTVAVPTWDTVSTMTVSVSVPGNARGGQTGNFVTNITGGTGPFEVTYTFDTGVTPLTTTHNITGRSDTLSATFNSVTADTNVSLTVTVKDANNRTGTRTRTFTLRPAVANTAPMITATADDASATIAVAVMDSENDDVTVIATPPAGMSVTNGTQTAVGGNTTLTFNFTADDPTAGASGAVSFSADDGNGGTANATATLNIAATGNITLAADTLYAVPSPTTVAVNTPVTITVYTGVPASAFQFMNGIRVIAPDTSGFTYVDSSFNVGVPGGAAGDTDGFWTCMNPAGGYLLPPDNFIQETNVSGQTAIDFNVTPIGGSDVTTCEGALFNFQATFDTAGTYQLGFMQFDIVDRTYYTDQNTAPSRFWGDITNLHTGIDSAVTVTP
jgi:hypothetical protein